MEYFFINSFKRQICLLASKKKDLNRSQLTFSESCKYCEGEHEAVSLAKLSTYIKLASIVRGNMKLCR